MTDKMVVLLVTTSTNAVRVALEQVQTIKLLTIDCATPKVNVLEDIEHVFHDSMPDVLITYRCPFIIPKSIFEQTRLGAYNIHPSLLPKYPGLNPWEKIFHEKERESGVTLHQLTEHVDAGNIIFQSSFIIKESDTIETSRNKADRVAAELVIKLTHIAADEQLHF